MRGFTFSPNAIGVGANVGAEWIAPTPMALGLNISFEAAWNIAVLRRGSRNCRGVCRRPQTAFGHDPLDDFNRIADPVL